MQGLSRAEFEARRATEAMKAQFESISATVQKVAAVVGVSLGANAFKEMITGAIDAQEALRNLGARAGISGEALSSLLPSAARSHTGLEDVANMSAKLSKALLEIDDPGSKASAVLGALGIKSKDAARLLADPAQAVFEIAKRLNELPEGGTKAAAQLLLVGRAGGTTSAFMKDLAEQTRLVATRTGEGIEAAAKFNDRLTDLGTNTKTLQTALANALLPTMNDVVSAFISMTTQGGGAKAKLDALTADNSLRDWARDSAILVGTVAESLLFVARGANAVVGSFKVVAAETALAIAATNAPSQKPFGTLGFSKAEADKYNADYEAALKHRNTVVAAADQSYLDLVNKNATAITDALRKQFAASDANVGGGGLFSDRSFQAKQDADAKRAKDAEARMRAAVAAAGRGAGGVDEFAKALDNVNRLASVTHAELAAAFSGEQILPAQRALASLMGDNVWKKFTDNQKEIIKFAYEGVIATEKETQAWRDRRAETEKQIKAYQDIEAAQAHAREAFTQKLGDYADNNDVLKREIALIGADDLAHQQLAASIEYERLAKQALAAEDTLGLAALDGQFAKRKELLKLQDDTIKKMKDEAEVRQLVSDTIGVALDDLIAKHKSLRDTLKDLESTWISALNRMAQKSLLDALFGKPGSDGGGGLDLGNIVGKILGLFGGPGGGSSPNLSPGDYINPSIGSLAGGTDNWRGGLTLVGERGPEIINLPKGSQVVPSDESRTLMRGKVVNITQHINVMPGASRASSEQAALEMARAARRAANSIG